ncbi:uncharacterized protein LOC103510933 [Diaphorina citri]|uniref:Uncharacterized protein LOC103510933 n=1 Tax=Diaphorina citri TaxID=121845 RepID=A0A3Q0IWL7_DIACI|nr:uncharacterized protein LOC103510933 [Diaphorina citri]
MLRQHNLKEAALLAKSFRAHYAKVVVRPVLAVSYLRTQDLPSLVTVVRAVCENWEKGEEGEKEEEGEEKTAGQLIDMDRIFAGNVLLDIYKATRQDPNVVSHLEQLLNAFVEHAIPISAFSSDYIQNGLGSALTSDISKALGALTSDDLMPQPLQYVPSMFIPRGQPLRCLDKDPLRRWSCDQLLRHPYFNGYYFEVPDEMQYEEITQVSRLPTKDKNKNPNQNNSTSNQSNGLFPQLSSNDPSPNEPLRSTSNPSVYQYKFDHLPDI